MASIGTNIRTLRQKIKITQEQLAEKLGVTFQAVSKWETNSNTPDISLLPGIAKELGCLIDDLFSDSDLTAAAMPDHIKDDDVIRIVRMQGKRFLEAHDFSKDEPYIHVRFPQKGSTPVYKVEIYGNLISDGTINGDVVCHGWIDCADIAGDVHADGDVRANGIYAVDDVTCNQIVECHNLKCRTLECSGDIHAVNLICENKSP